MLKNPSQYHICLINPPVLAVLEPWYDTPEFGRSGLAYLAGYLRQNSSYKINIIDAKFERLSFDAVLQKIKVLQPNMVGLTAFTNEIKPAAYQAALIKKVFPQITIVIGGVHVTALPEKTLQEFPSFDIGVIGEGEQTIFELTEALFANKPIEQIPGLVYRKNGMIFKSPVRDRIIDQDTIPLPAWDLLPPAKTYFVQSSRGCPYNCLFCMNPNGKAVRKRSVENVMTELTWIIDSFHPNRISFGDEIFSVDIERTHLLLDAMIERNIGDMVEWDVQTHVQYVNKKLFQKFKAAKVNRIELGVETGDETSLRKMGKGTNLDTIILACNEGKEAGVNIGTFLLFGQPDETIRSINKTIDIAVKINPKIPMFGIMTPYPGTEVAKLAARSEAGYKLLTTDWDEYNKQIGGAMEFANLSRRQIEWLQIKAYVLVYIKNKRFSDLIQFLWEYRKGGWEVLKKLLLGNKYIKDTIKKPKDYEKTIASPISVELGDFLKAREDWITIQNNQLKKYKSTTI